MKRTLLLIVFLAVMLGLFTSVHADVVFSDGFETAIHYGSARLAGP
jgi:hypothetical protein